MKIMIGIGHPAHVHLFKNLITKLKEDKHEIYVVARDKEVTFSLLNSLQIPFSIITSNRRSIVSKIYTFPIIMKEFIRYYKLFLPDLLIGGVGNAYISVLGILTGKPAIIFDDTEHSKYELFFVRNFAKTIVCPECYGKNLGKKQICYPGVHELAYLHPNHFKPNPFSLKELGIYPGEKYVIMRFVGWDALHDKGISGFTDENKIKAFKIFLKYGRVFISAETKLPSELEPYRIKFSPDKIHIVMAFASLFFGESATMASESAVLGVPSIYINDLTAGTIDEQERYGLLERFGCSETDQANSIQRGQEILSSLTIEDDIKKKRAKFLEDKIDTAAFMIWFVKNYPKSLIIMKGSCCVSGSYFISN